MRGSPLEDKSSILLTILGIQERPLSVASPEVGENDHTCNRRVRTPQRGECVSLDLHYNQQYRQVCRAEDYHHLDLRTKQ